MRERCVCVHKLRSPRGSKQSHISPDSGLKQLLFHAIITISHSLARSTLTTSGSTRGPQRTSLSARIFVAAHVLALPQHRVAILTNNDQNSVHVRPLARHSLAIKHPHWRTLRPVFCTQALQLCTWPPYPASCHSQAPATRFARRGASPGRTGIVCRTPVGSTLRARGYGTRQPRAPHRPASSPYTVVVIMATQDAVNVGHLHRVQYCGERQSEPLRGATMKARTSRASFSSLGERMWVIATTTWTPLAHIRCACARPTSTKS